MTKKIICLILISIFISCKKNILVTENEKNSVQKVVDFYNAECKSYKGFESENTNAKIYFELEISKSELLEENPERLSLHSGNIAYLFYSNLETEKDKYDEIRVKIISKKREISEHKYSNSEIKEIENFVIKIDKISELIKTRNYEAIKNLFDKSVQIETIELEELFKNVENQFGILKQYQFQGFEFMETDNFGEIVKFNIIQIMKKANINLTLMFNRKEKNLLTFEFQ
jgi:hypothetical protein